MKVSFWGSSGISVPFLESLLDAHQVGFVVTSADKPAGRGLKLKPSPVKEFALKNNLPVWTPRKLDEPDFTAHLSSAVCQLAVVVSYGKIIPPDILRIPGGGFVNLHFSLLPEYRGAAPIQWSLISGKKKTGVTSFFMDEGMDTGEIILQEGVEISDADDFFSLEKKLAGCGLEVLNETVRLISGNGAQRRKQTGEPSFAPALKKDDGKINWSKSPREIYNLIRGVVKWPTAWTNLPDSAMLKIFSAFPLRTGESGFGEGAPGQVAAIARNEGFIVRCGAGFLKVTEVQAQNKKRMSAWDFLQGGKLKSGDRLNTI